MEKMRAGTEGMTLLKLAESAKDAERMVSAGCGLGGADEGVATGLIAADADADAEADAGFR